MSLIESLRKALAPSPSFSVTSRQKWTDYSYLTESQNYFEQFFGWTYKAVKTVSDATVNYKLQLAKGDEESYKLQTAKESDLLRDLKRFNGFQTLTEARWITYAQKRLVGMAYWLIVKAETKPFKYEFYILNPTKMSLQVDQYGLPEFYVYQTPDGEKHNIDPTNLVVFKYPNPADWLKGMSVLQASRLSHNTYELAMRYNMNVFGNMGTPEGFLVIDGINAKEKRRAEKVLKQKYGSYKNAGKIGVLNKVAQWIGLTNSPRELQFKEGVTLMRDEILSMHGVPKPLVGLTDSTYTNSTEAQRIFQRYTIAPELTNEIDTLNEQLIPKYYMGTIFKSDDLFFINPDPVEADEEVSATTSTQLYQGGIIKLNEARRRVGEDPVPDEQDGFRVQGSPVSQEDSSMNDQNNENKDNGKTIKSLADKIEKIEDEVTENAQTKAQLSEKRNELRLYFYEKAISNEKGMEETCVSYFKEQGQRVLESLKPKKSIDLTYDFNLAKEVKYAEEYFAEIWEKIAKDANKTANDIIEDNVQMTNAVHKRLKERLSKFSEKINETTKKDIMKIIEEGIADGSGYSDIAKRLEEKFTSYVDGEPMTQTRAKMIAQTESSGIFNMVSRSTYANSELTNGYEWLTAHDMYVRTTPAGGHVAVDGVTVAKGQKFYVGGEYLEFPGDQNGSAENVINCRCTIIPVIK